MAEAVVGLVIEPNDPKYFCHNCMVDIPRVLDDYTCPTCLGGFIEELDASAAAPDDLGDSSDDEDDEMSDFDFMTQVGALYGMGNDRTDRGPSRRRNLRTVVDSGRRVRPRRSDRNRVAHELEHVIQDFFVNLTGVGWGPTGHGNRTGQPVRLFLGNPGDYAWGREGLDAIVTQLLNQMDVTGPPPLDKEKIKEIPVSYITQEQASSKLQCSICWDDFEAGECVKKLQCDHFYHDKCIVPWLELHGTCPICRKSLSGEDDNGESMEHTHLPDLSHLWRGAARWPSNSPSTSSTSTSSTSTTTSSSRRPRLHSDTEMDYEGVE